MHKLTLGAILSTSGGTPRFPADTERNPINSFRRNTAAPETLYGSSWTGHSPPEAQAKTSIIYTFMWIRSALLTPRKHIHPSVSHQLHIVSIFFFLGALFRLHSCGWVQCTCGRMWPRHQAAIPGDIIEGIRMYSQRVKSPLPRLCVTHPAASQTAKEREGCTLR